MRCTLCGSSETFQRRLFQVAPLISQWNSSFQIDVEREFKGLHEFELRTCSNCTLLFYFPDSLAGSAELYAQLDRFDWYYAPRKWEYEIALTDLQAGERVLEVGCGAGSFLQLAADEANASVEGLEQNQDAIDIATSKGLRVSRATAEEFARLSPSKYDVVCSFQVLEHVVHPGEFLKACCSLLRPGGKLLLGLPNADSFLKYEFNLLDLPPHHMSRWTADVLSNIPKLFPLCLRSIAYEPLADHHVGSYVNSYFPLLFRGPLAPLRHPHVLGYVSTILRRSGIRRWLRGQTFYVSYDRVEGPH